MRAKQFDLNLLKVFEALYQERNMTVAARSLHISPSAVSHAVKRLRESLQDPLFVRHGQTMMPTPACNRLAPELISKLNEINNIIQYASNFDPSSSRQQFKIAIHEAIEGQFVPNMIALLYEFAPQTEMLSSSLNRDDMNRQLRTGEIDIVIDVARSLRPPIMHTQLLSDPFCVMMNPLHPLANRTLTLDDYLVCEHIVVSSRSNGSVIEDRNFQQLGINRQIKHRCQSYITAAEVVKQSQLLLTLPQSIADRFEPSNVTIKTVPIKLPPTATHMYWHQNSENDQALTWLRQLVLQHKKEI